MNERLPCPPVSKSFYRGIKVALKLVKQEIKKLRLLQATLEDILESHKSEGHVRVTVRNSR